MLVAAIAALGVLCAGCGGDDAGGESDDGGMSDAPPDGGGADAPGDTGPVCSASLGYTSTEACATCQKRQCCDRVETCVGNDGCVELRDCIEDSGSPNEAWACYRRPETREEPSYTDYVSFSGCARQCPEECGTGARLDCAMSYEIPDPPSDTGSVRVGPIGASPPGTVADVTVRACPSLDDLDCADPLAQGTTGDTAVRLDGLPMPFTGGYFEAIHAEAMRARMRVSPPSHIGRKENAPPYGFLFLTDDQAVDVFEDLEVSRESSKGHIVIRFRDCRLDPAGGIRFELEGDPDALRFYLTSDFQISTDATATEASVQIGELNLPNGAGGFANVEPGAVTVRAFGPDDTLLTELDVTVRADELVSLLLHPQPR